LSHSGRLARAPLATSQLLCEFGEPSRQRHLVFSRELPDHPVLVYVTVRVLKSDACLPGPTQPVQRTTWLLPRQPLVHLGEQFLPKLGITSRAALRDALATVSRPGRDDPSARAHGWLRRPR
jgi:hypothetical protein